MATNNQYMAQKIIRRMGDDTTERYYLNSAFHAGLGRGNGMAFKGLVRKGFVALADVGLGYVLTPAGQQEYERLFPDTPQPAAAPAREPQAITPADEAALGVSMSELDAALAEIARLTNYAAITKAAADYHAQREHEANVENERLQAELDAANAKLAEYRQHDLDAIGTLVYGETDEQAAYQERSGRPDADDDLLTIEEVRDYLDIEGGHHGD